MNQTFEWQRLVMLFKKYWAENKKRYGLAMVALAGLLIILFLFMMLVDETPLAKGEQQIVYYITLFMVGSFFASQYFSDFSARTTTANFLLVPASVVEKTVCGILFVLPLFIGLFTLTFYAVDALMVTAANLFHPTYQTDYTLPVANVFTAPAIPARGVPYVFLVFAITQSAYLFGGAYFEKYTYIKTAILGFVVFISLFLLVYVLNESLMPAGGYESLTSFRVNDNTSTDKLVQMPGWFDTLIEDVLIFLIPPFFWYVTYLCLKEKEV